MTFTHTDSFKYIFHSRSDKVFVANVSKITTFNKDVLDSEWTLASRTFRLVTASQQIRVSEVNYELSNCGGDRNLYSPC